MYENLLNRPTQPMELTNLVEVLLVLVIVFAITPTGMLMTGYRVDPPGAPSAKPIVIPADATRITVNARGEVRWNGQMTEIDQVQLMGRQHRESHPNNPVYVLIDKAAPHGVGADVRYALHVVGVPYIEPRKITREAEK